MVHRHRFNFLSTNLEKLPNTFQIGGLTTIKSLFSRKTENTKVPNLFDIYYMLVKIIGFVSILITYICKNKTQIDCVHTTNFLVNMYIYVCSHSKYKS